MTHCSPSLSAILHFAASLLAGLVPTRNVDLNNDDESDEGKLLDSRPYSAIFCPSVHFRHCRCDVYLDHMNS